MRLYITYKFHIKKVYSMFAALNDWGCDRRPQEGRDGEPRAVLAERNRWRCTEPAAPDGRQPTLLRAASDGGDVHAGDEGSGGEGEKEEAGDDAAVSRIFCWGVAEIGIFGWDAGGIGIFGWGNEAEDVGGDAER